MVKRYNSHLYPIVKECEDGGLHTKHTRAEIWEGFCMCTQLLSHVWIVLCDPMDWSPPGSSVHGDSPGKTTEVGCHFLLQAKWEAPEKDCILLILSDSLIGSELTASYTASLVAQLVKNLPAVQETQVQSVSWEDPLEKDRAIHSSSLVWEIQWTEEPDGLQSIGLQRVIYDLVTKLPPPATCDFKF